MGPREPFTIKPGDDVFIMQMGGLRRVMCDRITPDGAVFRDLTPDEADGGLFTPQNVSGPRYGEPVSEDSYHQARRGGEVEAWIKRWRDRYTRQGPRWLALDDMLDDYRLHADTGTPLSGEVREHDER